MGRRSEESVGPDCRKPYVMPRPADGVAPITEDEDDGRTYTNLRLTGMPSSGLFTAEELVVQVERGCVKGLRTRAMRTNGPPFPGADG